MAVPSEAAPRKDTSKERKGNRGAASASLAVGEPGCSKPRHANADRTLKAPRTSLGSGVAKPIGAGIDWASLLRRVYLDDVLACPCGGRRRIVAHIEEPDAIAAILGHLDLPTDAPPIARARSPDSETV